MAAEQQEPQFIVLAPDLGTRRYDEVAERLSMPARHLLWFLVELAKEGRVHRDTLRATLKKRRDDWTEEQVESYARCFSQLPQ